MIFDSFLKREFINHIGFQSWKAMSCSVGLEERPYDCPLKRLTLSIRSQPPYITVKQ